MNRLMELSIISQFDDGTTFDWAVRYRYYGQSVITVPEPTIEAAWERIKEIYESEMKEKRGE